MLLLLRLVPSLSRVRLRSESPECLKVYPWKRRLEGKTGCFIRLLKPWHLPVTQDNAQQVQAEGVLVPLSRGS